MDPQLAALLDQLRDLHTPETISWWPPAIGWWLLLLLLPGLLALTLWLVRRRRQQQAFRHQALAELERAYAQWQAAGDGAHFLASCAQLLRRLALHAGERKDVAALSGSAWNQHLASLSRHQLNPEHQTLVAEGQYRRNPLVDGDALHADLRQYILAMETSHRV